MFTLVGYHRDSIFAITAVWSSGDGLGLIDLNGCDGLGRLGGKVFDVVIVAGGRGYNFTMEGDVTRSLLLAMLATVKFQPGRATD